jgi:hypothetical protein
MFSELYLRKLNRKDMDSIRYHAQSNEGSGVPDVNAPDPLVPSGHDQIVQVAYDT